jgi:hypothetical protein
MPDRPLKRLRVVSAVLVLLAACASPTDQGRSPLVGRWATAPEDLSPSGWHQYHMTFAAEGAFALEVRSYGVYAGQPHDELSAYSRTEGSYRVDGERLVFEPQRLVWWDRFYGVASPEHVEDSYPYGSLFNAATYVVRDNQLTLRYVSYPADAPVPTSMVFIRVEADLP